MPIYKGQTKIVKLYKGSEQIVKRYKGTNLIYSVGRLPSAFQEVEYIESTGTQYIDSGVYGKETTKIVFGFQMTDTTNIQYLFGASQTFNTNALSFSFNKDARDYLYRVFFGNPSGDNGNVRPDGINSFSTKTSVDSCVITNTSISLDNELYNYEYPQTTSFTTPNTITLFARNNAGTISFYASYKLKKYFQIYDNNVLVRDFVPCYRKSDSVIGLYDLVNDVFYTNAGTGTFSKGPDTSSITQLKCQVK